MLTVILILAVIIGLIVNPVVTILMLVIVALLFIGMFVVLCIQSGKNEPEAVEFTSNMSPLDYEKYVAYKLSQQGFTDVEVTKASGDFGADVLARDKGGHKMCFQCKMFRPGHKVGVRAVQEVSSARTYYGCTRAAVVTTSVFTDAAKELAQKSGVELYEHFYDRTPPKFKQPPPSAEPKEDDDLDWIDRMAEIESIIED